MSLIQGRSSVIMGEDIEFSNIALPTALEGKSLQSSKIGGRTGLIVLSVDHDGKTEVSPGPEYLLEPGSRLNVLGTSEQLARFRELFT